MFLQQEEPATILTPVKKKIKNVGIFLKVCDLNWTGTGKSMLVNSSRFVSYSKLGFHDLACRRLHAERVKLDPALCTAGKPTFLWNPSCFCPSQNDDEDDDEEEGDDAEELLGKGARSAALLADRTRVSVDGRVCVCLFKYVTGKQC